MRILSLLKSSLLRKTISELLATLCTSSLHCKCFCNSSFWELWHLVANIYYTLLLRFLCSFKKLFACFINSQFTLLPSTLSPFLSLWITRTLASCSFIHDTALPQTKWIMEELPINHTRCESPSLVHLSACWTMKILSSPWRHWLKKPSHTPTTKEAVTRKHPIKVRDCIITTYLGGCTALKEAPHSSLQAPSALHYSGDTLRIISM